ncbi:MULTISPECIES: chromosomal replication initiator protein DnaA [unclassified Luteibacter]|uniref:chromosomal replication initiator protein DnaA n=1 Tax=unclassified Luteibacter TaxID=2620188 RepID=UPI0008AC00BF|nr:MULTISPECIES: chromosomal replication initiator protein DnaA [unclassified Luteibacter]MDR6937498.1 chromosomal replication initiator protein [Luteibacter sp. 3190]SEO34949.1 chromosomal replication initiator protein [Luteibacter sp. UNC138MFCol5.1]SEW24105.1 chromosomal replication initiator protein DnaA [Luteibacter sp. 329MFSha]
MSDLWRRCLERLEGELTSEDVHTWLMPLQAREDATGLFLYAPNPYSLDTVREQYLGKIQSIVEHLTGRALPVRLEVGSSGPRPAPARPASATAPSPAQAAPRVVEAAPEPPHVHNLDPHYTFETFVEGKSNQLGKAAAMQVAMNPGRAYNPLLLYGGTGLGKTHLMHAAGNMLMQNNPGAKVLYLRSEQFVSGMVKALQQKNMDDFKRRFRSVDALLIDDIQFFAGKDTTQEEFFHTFNALFEAKQQIILTCDRYPKELDKLEPRLKSRLGWGLSVAIEPPDFETRAAILLSKAAEKDMEVSEDVAMLLAKRIRSNVRDLEGALNTLAARANFYRKPITTDFAEETLRDLLNTHAQAVTVPNIQKTVADYYQVRLSDLLSKRRVRSLARPRQVAMALSKELTEHSLPEIGEAFGGRDHTTVLHACRTIRGFCEKDVRMRQDWEQLIRILTG